MQGEIQLGFPLKYQFDLTDPKTQFRAVSDTYKMLCG
jgi:hypothetical protein